METMIDNFIKIFAIMVAIVHFLAAFVFYREMLRVNNVIKTRRYKFYIVLVNFYILAMLGVFIVVLVL